MVERSANTLPQLLAVRRSEFRALVRDAPFVALPREEIGRLHAAMEVLAVEEEAVRGDGDVLTLHGAVALHHNYSWLTFRRPDGQRSLLLSSALAADGELPLFLDEAMLAGARSELDETLAITGSYEFRLAGILQEVAHASSSSRVTLLSIARLTSRVTNTEATRCGNLDLRDGRAQFDPLSQVVIDHLDAL